MSRLLIAPEVLPAKRNAGPVGGILQEANVWCPGISGKVTAFPGDHAMAPGGLRDGAGILMVS